MLMRSLTTCLLALLFLAACAEDPPEPEALTVEPEEEGATVPTEPEEIIEGADDLIGRWVILEQAGTAPEDLYYVTFTREGDYIVQNEFGSTERSSFRPAGDDLIAITDSSGTRRYAYEVDGNTLVLGVPGSETRTVLERRN
jgi:hypothetical protein